MARYRRRPAEVEAWKIGSDEPMPEWVRKHLTAFPRIERSYTGKGVWLVLDCWGSVRYRTHHQFAQDYEPVCETNYQLYYGSPERVVETNERTEACASSEDGRIEAEDCDVCKLAPVCNYEPSLEWLREEAS